VAGQGRSQPGTVGAGPFHPDPHQGAVTGKPAVELPIALSGGGETLVAQHRAEMADRRHGVGVGVSIDTAEHQQRLPGTVGVGQRDSFWHGWHHSLPFQPIGSLGVSRSVGQHSDERFDKLLSSHDRSVDTNAAEKTDHKLDIHCYSTVSEEKSHSRQACRSSPKVTIST
jgi:hypothetical protein